MNEPVDEFVIEEIVSESPEENDGKADSERKFY